MKASLLAGVAASLTVAALGVDLHWPGKVIAGICGLVWIVVGVELSGDCDG